MKKYILWLADLRVSAVLILLLAINTFIGTLMQGAYGLWAAQEAVFHSWIARFPLGEGRYIPFVGVPTLGLLAIVNLLAVLAVKIRWNRRQAGLWILHVGLLSLLVSAGFSWFYTRSGVLELGPGEQTDRYESTTDWELVLRVESDSGTFQWMYPLQDVNEGDTLSMGPYLSETVVQAYSPHGILIGESQQVTPLPQKGGPERFTPVLNLLVIQDQNKKRLGLSAEGSPWVLRPGALLYLRKESRPLPFRIKMVHFEKVMHPGTGIAARYTTQLQLIEGNSSREVRISMNEPLRVGHFTLFQSSWKAGINGAGDRSVLAVVENPWRQAPYASTLLIALGLLIHTGIHLRKAYAAKRGLALWVVVALGLSAYPSHGMEAPESLMRLPLQIDGRVKPLDSYARQLLLQISGRSRGASDWLAGVLLGNGSQDAEPVFLIENPETRDALGLTGKARDRYSWLQLEPLGPKIDTLARMALMFEPADRTRAQRDLLRVADSWNRYYAVRHALDPIRAWAPPRPSPFSNAPPIRDFLDFVEASARIAPTLDSLLRLPESQVDSMARVQMDWVQQTLQKSHVWRNVEFTIWPEWDGSQWVWQSPGAELVARGPDSSLVLYFKEWRAMHQAYIQQNPSRVAFLADSMARHFERHVGSGVARPKAWAVEYLYNRIEPFFRAMLLYGLAVVFSLLFWWQGHGVWQKLSYGVLALAWLLHGVGLILRSYITWRPPATNLYETFVFSAAVAVVLALVAGHWRNIKATSGMAALGGASLLFLARRYGMEGDTMPVLAAVLDSNFWLSIHVLSITVGYAGVLVGGGYAHLHLWWRHRYGEGSVQERASFATLRLLMMVGLFFTFLGTLLGAVWADQSWGRFWGWDPKENGALLIILWLAFLFHAMPCGWLKRRGFSLGAIFAIQTVLFAWFGVNLMGVGLHSYGFTEGALQGLLAFALVELAFVVRVNFSK